MAALDFPVSLRLAGRRVLVVGGGVVASQRVGALVEAGARVAIVAPELTRELAASAGGAAWTWLCREYRDGDVEGFALVFTATDSRAVTERVAAEARRRGVWINAADVPELCDFAMPSVARHGPIAIAVSTAGAAPALARKIRTAASAQVGRGHVELARVVGFLRGKLAPGPERMRLLTTVVEGGIGDALIAGDRRAAFAELRALIARTAGANP